MTDQVNKICQSTYLEIRRIGSIRKYLTVDATKTLVTSLVLSRLDYCNSLLAGLPQGLTDKLQKVMNCAAHLIFKVPLRQHISPFLADLHWLNVSSRVQYKIATLCFHIANGPVPPYLS